MKVSVGSENEGSGKGKGDRSQDQELGCCEIVGRISSGVSQDFVYIDLIFTISYVTIPFAGHVNKEKRVRMISLKKLENPS